MVMGLNDPAVYKSISSYQIQRLNNIKSKVSFMGYNPYGYITKNVIRETIGSLLSHFPLKGFILFGYYFHSLKSFFYLIL